MSLELRACNDITDKGVIELCEGLSGLKEAREDDKVDEGKRYLGVNRYEYCGTVRYLNLSDLKQITVSYSSPDPA